MKSMFKDGMACIGLFLILQTLGVFDLIRAWTIVLMP